MTTDSLFRSLRRAAFAAVVLTLPAASQSQSYTIVDLGVLDGGSNSGSAAINASGQTVGYSDTADPNLIHAALWTGTTPVDLGTLGGTYSSGLGVNASGQVVGISYLAGDEQTHAFIYDGAGLRDLGTLGGPNSAAVAINASGQVVGNADLPDGAGSRAVIWTGTKAQNLGALGGAYSFAYGINDSGQVAGVANTASSSQRAVRWTGTTAQDLGDLGGANSAGRGINASGQVVGYSYTANSFHAHAVRWTGLKAEDLGTLYNGNAFGYAINRSGVVVGDIKVDFGGQYAFIYTNGRMTDLNTLLPSDSGWQLTGASGINDSGWIVGAGSYNGQQHAYLLKPAASAGVSRIALEGVADLSKVNPAAPLSLFHISLRAPGATTEIAHQDIALTAIAGSAYGTYTLSGVPNGVYDIAIKGDKSLRVVVRNFTLDGAASLPDVTLPAGDGNNDNFCDTSDFGLLVGVYGADSSVSGSGYDPAADFNYDGLCDTGDFGLLVGNYGQQGDK